TGRTQARTPTRTTKKEKPGAFLALVFDGKTLIDRATHSLHQAFAAAELLWLNWIMENNLDRARRDPEARLGHQRVASDDRHWHDWHVTFHREIEGTLL